MHHRARPHLDVAVALTAAVQAIHQPRTLEDTLDAVVQAARSALPGFDQVGISIAHRDGRIETLAGTDQLVWELDDLQYRLDQGPCVESIRAAPVVLVEDARHEQRWPDYIPAAVGRGLRAQLALRLDDGSQTIGGLNLYSTCAATVQPDAVAVAELFATHATIALGRARQEEQLNQALATRKVIGQATGIVMERYRIDEDHAFQLLARASATGNLKLRTVAQEIVDAANAGRPWTAPT